MSGCWVTPEPTVEALWENLKNCLLRGICHQEGFDRFLLHLKLFLCLIYFMQVYMCVFMCAHSKP